MRAVQAVAWKEIQIYFSSPTAYIVGMIFLALTGVFFVQDLGDPENARRMGQALFDRWRRGDTPTNLSITSLVTNAFLLTGEEKYRDWVVEYTDAWVERAKQNDGLLPDNVGHSGQVGEYLDGKWYGGRYGWTFPHGFLTLQKATLDAGAGRQSPDTPGGEGRGSHVVQLFVVIRQVPQVNPGADQLGDGDAVDSQHGAELLEQPRALRSESSGELVGGPDQVAQKQLRVTRRGQQLAGGRRRQVGKGVYIVAAIT